MRGRDSPENLDEPATPPRDTAGHVLRCVGSCRQKGDVSAIEIKTPANRALAVLNAAAPAEPIAQRRISKKVRSGIGFMVSGDCKIIKDAAEKVGLSREHFTRELSKPHIAAYMRERVLKQLAIAAARAGAVKGDLLDSDNDMVRDRASSFVLGLAGIAPAATPGVAINVEIKAGYVIDLTDDPRRPGADGGMRIISPTVYSPPIDADPDRDSAKWGQPAPFLALRLAPNSIRRNITGRTR